jgi:hypothetical protein
MADIATPDFLDQLKSLYPTPVNYVDGDWFLAAGIAFSSSNCPEGIPCVLRHALEDLNKLPNTSDEDRRLLVRKMRDGIFKSGMISGYPKVNRPYLLTLQISQNHLQAINALASLYEATPEVLRDTETLRFVCELPLQARIFLICCLAVTPVDRNRK